MLSIYHAQLSKYLRAENFTEKESLNQVTWENKKLNDPLSGAQHADSLESTQFKRGIKELHRQTLLRSLDCRRSDRHPMYRQLISFNKLCDTR